MEDREGVTGSHVQPDPPEERGCEEHLLHGRRKEKIKLSAATTFLSHLFCKCHSDTNPPVTELLQGHPCQITAPSGPGIGLPGTASVPWGGDKPCVGLPSEGGGCGQTYLSQVVKVVLVVHPLVVGCHAVRPVGDVPDVNPQAVVELALEKLQEGSDPIRLTFPTGFPTGFPRLPGMYRSCQDAAWPARLQAT